MVPSDTHAKRRVVFGAVNIVTGHLELLITETWEALTWRIFLRHIRLVWRGWRIVLFVDRGSPHRAYESRRLATALGIELRFLPTATPELNALENLWRDGKRKRLANRRSETVDQAADAFCEHLLTMSPEQRLNTAGLRSGRFWLTEKDVK